MEETISRMAGAEWGIRMEPHEFDEAILAIDRVPVQRTTTYKHLHRKELRTTRHGDGSDLVVASRD
jgi:2-iminoacetate synthase ThiH